MTQTSINEKSAQTECPPAQFLDQRVQPLAGYPFWERSPVAGLYRDSVALPETHFEGAAAWAAILQLRQEQEGEVASSEVASREDILARLAAILDYAEAVFRELPEVEAVAVFGSILWKKRPGDFDTVTFTSYEAPSSSSDCFYSVNNSVEDRATKGLVGSQNIPDNILGVRRNAMEIFVCSNDEERIPRPGVSVLRKGPHLVIVRGDELPFAIPDPLRVFFHAARPYQDKAPIAHSYDIL